MSETTGAARQVQSEKIAEQLEEDIVAGRMQPGQRIDEVLLARRFGVSRTPVREALQLLCGRALAERVPYRGVLVARIEPGHIDLMFEAMAELEVACVRFACQRMSMSERAELEDLHVRMDAMAEAEDFDSYERANVQFHDLLFEGCHNAELIALADSIRLRLAPFRRYQLRDAGRIKRSCREHHEIVSAIVAKDARAAESAVRRHLASAAREVIARRRQEAAP